VASWSANAAGEYQALQAKWDGSASDLNQVLRQMAQALRTAADNYQSTERKNSSIWS
jgi:ESAT-6 family protein